MTNQPGVLSPSHGVRGGSSMCGRQQDTKLEKFISVCTPDVTDPLASTIFFFNFK